MLYIKFNNKLYLITIIPCFYKIHSIIIIVLKHRKKVFDYWSNVGLGNVILTNNSK